MGGMWKEELPMAPRGAGPYRGLNARIPIGKNLYNLCVSAVKKYLTAEAQRARRMASAERGPTEDRGLRG